MWESCLQKLQTEISAEDISTWIMPLHTNFSGSTLNLLAPNRYVLNHVKHNLLDQITRIILAMNIGVDKVCFEIGSYGQDTDAGQVLPATTDGDAVRRKRNDSALPYSNNLLNPDYTFDSHVEGKSNQLARAAALAVGKNPGSKGYNPLFIYGGVGLGKTHLMQAAGRLILDGNANAKVVYVHSEVFVNDMIKAIQKTRINEFKQYYRSLDALLIDDIQFFADKPVSQEEFFHTFNTLREGQRQIIITSDRLPKSIKISDRLTSRFDGGLTVSIDPPELETRVAIIEKKALEQDVELPSDVAFFVANAIYSNVRELEGALHKILAHAKSTARDIDLDLVREALRDVLIHQKKQMSIENIQRTVAEYYKIRVADLLSQRRSRDIARPRQLAMCFARQFTTMSLPQIGDRFGGKNHTTVLHACRRIEELLQSDPKMKEDHDNLHRLLGG